MGKPRLDGDVYPIQFRLHDNRFPNSPKAIRIQGGTYRSDLLMIGEPGFDPVRGVLSIGIGGDRGLSAASGNQDGDLLVDQTPIASSDSQTVLTERGIYRNGKSSMRVSSDGISVRSAVMMQDDAGDDTVKVGHGYMKAAVTTLYSMQPLLTQILNIKTAQATPGFNAGTLAAMIASANHEIDILYDPLARQDITKLAHNFPEVYGAYDNLLTQAEDFSHTDWVKTNLTVDANIVIAPDGTLTADMLTDASSSDSNIRHDFTISTVAERRCFSVFLRRGTAAKTSIRVGCATGGSAVFTDAEYEWDTGAITGSGIAYPTNDPDWIRLAVEVKSNTSNTICSCTIRPAGGTTADVGTVYAWGAMLNVGRAPEFYVA